MQQVTSEKVDSDVAFADSKTFLGIFDAGNGGGGTSLRSAIFKPDDAAGVDIMIIFFTNRYLAGAASPVAGQERS